MSENLTIAKKIREELGLSVVNQLVNNKPPKLVMRKRTSDNIKYQNGILVLGNKTIERKMNDVSEIKAFTQTLVLGRVITEALEQGHYPTQRDLYYTVSAFELPNGKLLFKDQPESDAILRDIEVLTGYLREDMGIVTKEKGQIVGKIVFEGKVAGEKVRIDCSKTPMLPTIPSLVDRIKILEVDADFVLVIEKSAVLESLWHSGFWKKYNCLLVTGSGQPDRATRRMVRRLAYEFELPVYVLVDGDPYGWHIYSVYKMGSMTLSYESEKLSCPKAQFIGVSESDIFEYKLNKLKNATMKAKDTDVKRAKDMMKYPWFKEDEFWQREFKLFLKHRLKTEIEAFSRYHFGYLQEKYLPAKLKI